MPHPSQPAPDLDTTEAVRKARHQATVVTCAAAVVPTVLAMQGMASLAVDLLGFGLPLAIALAGFLELALVSFALLTRASALAGRPGGVDAIAVWVVSATSGLFSGAHELIGPAIGGTRAWEVDPGSLLAAGVRVAAPLVAALLWERVLTAARREHEARSLVEVRRDRRLIAVAVAALTVRQLAAEHRPGRRPTVRMRRARRVLQRKHVAALRMVGPGPDLRSVLAAVGAVDVLPAATIVQSLDAPPTTSHVHLGEVHQGQLDGPPADQGSHQELAAEPPAGTPDQGEPARGLESPPEPTIPDQANHSGPAHSGPGWLDGSPESYAVAHEVESAVTEPAAGPHGEPAGQGEPAREPGSQPEWTTPDQGSHPIAREVESAVTEAAAGPQVGPVPGQVDPGGYQGGPGRAGSAGQAPVITAAEAAIRDASVLDLADQGLSQRAIATRLGVARSTVARAVARHVASAPPAPQPGSHPVDHTEPETAPVGHNADHPVDQWSTEDDSALVR